MQIWDIFNSPTWQKGTVIQKTIDRLLVQFEDGAQDSIDLKWVESKDIIKPNISIEVIAWDIMQIPSDWLITAVNGWWMRWWGIDNALQREAWMNYHNQIWTRETREDGKSYFAKWPTPQQREKNVPNLKINNVIFVIDDLQLNLSHIIQSGLEEAFKNWCTTVTIPAIRTWVMLWAKEKTLEDVVQQYKLGIEKFQNLHPDASMNITFVIYKNDTLLQMIQDQVIK